MVVVRTGGPCKMALLQNIKKGEDVFKSNHLFALYNFGAAARNLRLGVSKAQSIISWENEIRNVRPPKNELYHQSH